MAMRPYSRGTNERLALSLLGERVDRDGAVTSRRGPGEGVARTMWHRKAADLKGGGPRYLLPGHSADCLLPTASFDPF
jgi:hypothetical protein